MLGGPRHFVVFPFYFSTDDYAHSHVPAARKAFTALKVLKSKNYRPICFFFFTPEARVPITETSFGSF